MSEDEKRIMKELENLCKQKEYRQLKKLFQETVHPTEEDLTLFAFGILTDKQKEEIGVHLIFCRQCSEAASLIREIDQEAREIAMRPSAAELLERITSRGRESLRAFIELNREYLNGLQVESLAFQRVPTRSISTTVGGKKFNVGDSINLYVKTDNPRYMIVFHKNSEGKVKLIFPSSGSVDNFLDEQSSIKVTARVTPPTGKEEFVVFGTKEPIIDPEEIDYDMPGYLPALLEEITNKLDGLDKDDWDKYMCEYEVENP